LGGAEKERAYAAEDDVFLEDLPYGTEEWSWNIALVVSFERGSQILR
jgi:hypothetical protein